MHSRISEPEPRSPLRTQIYVTTPPSAAPIEAMLHINEACVGSERTVRGIKTVPAPKPHDTDRNEQ
ncbi:hypothetical protein CLAFUR0_14498 [Fulvia fulva]|nr:hypothetical protein CLAFUR0_14498 [Fulvia fulva]